MLLKFPEKCGVLTTEKYTRTLYILFRKPLQKKKHFNRFFRIIPPWSEWKSDIPVAITSVAIVLHWKYFRSIFINLRLLPIIIPIANTIDQAGYFFFIVVLFFFCTSFVARSFNENRPWERKMLERGRFATFHWINNNIIIITIRTWTEHPQRPSMTCGHKFNPICKYFIESLVDVRRVNV